MELEREVRIQRKNNIDYLNSGHSTFIPECTYAWYHGVDKEHAEGNIFHIITILILSDVVWDKIPLLDILQKC